MKAAGCCCKQVESNGRLQIRKRNEFEWIHKGPSLLVSMHRIGMDICRALLRWLSMWLDFCVFPPSQRSFDRHSVYSLRFISYCQFLSKSSNKGKNPLEVHENWHHVLCWICWHCCGLLCKYTSVDFVKHKLCKCPFRDSSKCRLLAWCLETIYISDVNLYSGTTVLQPVDV